VCAGAAVVAHLLDLGLGIIVFAGGMP